MATQRSERPRFFEGQYIGAADLSAVVDYTRGLSREAALGGQTWGVAIGLDLVEVEAAGGGFDYFVLPGLAWDGYGRPIVVLSPAAVPAAKFADLPTGAQKVWLRYDETAFRGLRPGWETCGDEDSFARVRESFAIEVGAFSQVRERQSGVEIAGALEEDARLGLRRVDKQAPLVCDGSMPHQTYPEDKARWLVPVGMAAWQAGAPGSLQERSEDARKTSRAFRRYLGQVAESVYAADGILRLRDRMTQFKAGDSPDDLCGKSAVKDGDLILEPDRDDSTKTTERLVGRELVWVEGHMRVTGDARLFGTRLEVRDAAGAERGDVPLFLRRGATANAGGGEDLEIAVGKAADGKSRLVAGLAEPGKPFTANLQFRNDGRLAVGPLIPADVKAHTILAATAADTSLARARATKKVAKLQFATTPTLTPTGHIALDDDLHKLRFGVGDDLALFSFIDANGRLGVKTDAPGDLDGDASDLVVKSAFNVGLTLLCDAGQAGRINFADGVAAATDRHAGFIRYDHATERMEFGAAGATRAVISPQGNVGLGLLAPAARLHVQSLTDSHTLRIDADRIQADNGGFPSQLVLQPAGGGLQIGGAASIERLGAGNPTLNFTDSTIVRSTVVYNAGDQRTYVTNKNFTTLSLDGERLGVGIGQTAPTAALHVRRFVSADAGDLTSYVALLENSAGGSADVLALKVNDPSPGDSNNFITFFGSGGPVGRIEGAGGGSVAFISSGADFAECLPREAVAPIGPGRVVGVRNGRVSLRTEGADGLLVTTDRAVVVGNAPDRDAADGWERVALVGQVRVEVEGAVSPGDFIVPSGRNDGVGRPVAPGSVTPQDASRVIGRAWEAASDAGRKPVNIAVGAPGATAADAFGAALTAQNALIAELQTQVEALMARLRG